LERLVAFDSWCAVMQTEHVSVCEGRLAGSATASWRPLFKAFNSQGWLMRPADQRGPHESSQGPFQVGGPDVTFVVVRPVVDVGVTFYVARPDEAVMFDVDLAEVANQRSLDAVMIVVRCVGLTTRRDVLFSDEDKPDAVLGWYDPEFDRVVIAAWAGA
jgi:hypothetical protein